MDETTNGIITTQKESIKLLKMSKGYNWEIKVFPIDEEKNKLEEKDLNRLETLDKIMRRKFNINV